MLLVAGLASPVRGQFRLHCLDAPDLRIVYYDAEHTYVIPHMARCFENSLRFYKQLFGYQPSEEVTILLQDFDDYGYAGTTTIPNNYMTLGIEPYEYVYETCPTNERMNWVMSHELVHVLASDQAAGADRVFRRLFLGKVNPTAEDPISMLYSYLTNPRRYAPRWYHEGIAVFMETWLAGGIGRVLGGYDEMVFRTMVRDSVYFYDVVGLQSEGTTIDFEIGQNAYLYGTRFVTYLAYHYGPDKLLEWMRRSKGTKAYFSSQFKRVYGVSLDREWSKWIEWEHRWQRANLDTIRVYPLTSYHPLAGRILGSVSRAFYDRTRRRLYAAVNYPGRTAHVAAIDIATGAEEPIVEIGTPALYYVASVAYDESTGTLFYTTDNSQRWRDINAVNVDTGRKKLLLKNGRIGDLAFNRKDRCLWGIQHHDGKSRLVRLPPPYDDWQQIIVLPYGKDLFSIDISPDGRHMSGALVDVTGRQWLILMEIDTLLAGDSSYKALYEFAKNAPENFVFSSDGRYLYGTSYYTGVSNVFRYDLSAGKMEALSNCETGFFRPTTYNDDSLIVFRYTKEGFLPVMIPIRPIEDVNPIRFLGQAVVERYPQLKQWTLPPPSHIDFDSLSAQWRDYSALSGLRISSAYPIAKSYKDQTCVGLRFNMMDPVGMNALDLTFTYSPTKKLAAGERSHARFSFRHWPWTVKGAYNRADFYDFFGPTKTSRKGYSLDITYNNMLIAEKHRKLEYTLRAAGYTGLERLPEYQNIATSFDKFMIFTGDLSFESLLKTIGSVEPEKGTRWRLALLNTIVKSKSYPKAYFTLDKGFLTPVPHLSVWLRNVLGYARGEMSDPFANFYFGGFGNNWIDHGEVNRYRDYYSFPGKELNDVDGTNFLKSTVEIVFPPKRFHRFGLPALYCTWFRPALFVGGLTTKIDSKTFRRDILNVGVQVNFKLVIFSSLASTFSVGYAVAMEERVAPSRELLVSLKIL